MNDSVSEPSPSKILSQFIEIDDDLPGIYLNSSFSKVKVPCSPYTLDVPVTNKLLSDGSILQIDELSVLNN